MIKKHKIWFGLAASLLVGLCAVLYVPVSFPLSPTAVSGPVKAEGPITQSSPFEYCLHSNIDHPSVFKIFLATYGRTNTSTYDFDLFSMQNGQKTNFDHEEFSATQIADNSFHSFQIPQGTIPQPFCFSLTSKDATDPNAITVILDGHSEPVFEAWEQGTLADLLQKTWLQKEWNTGNALGYGVFIIYLTALIFFCGYILNLMHEKK